MKRRTLPEVERKIGAFFSEHRRMPTYGEMLSLLGVRSKSVVDFWVKKLISRGLLEKDAKGFLRPLKKSFSLPLVGEVNAGFPSPAEEELRDILSLDEYLISHPESSFLLKVSGDSMVGEGIKPGDLVIVDRARQPKNGDVVVVEVDGQWTMKYFRKRGSEIILEAANHNYPPVKPRQEVKLGGVVTAVIRKYHL